jgi:tetrahydromethanopterin S-methyltransferase subunit G
MSPTGILRGVVIGLVLIALTRWVLANVSLLA